MHWNRAAPKRVRGFPSMVRIDLPAVKLSRIRIIIPTHRFSLLADGMLSWQELTAIGVRRMM
jgi:hypothetical protein